MAIIKSIIKKINSCDHRYEIGGIENVLLAVVSTLFCLLKIRKDHAIRVGRLSLLPCL